jgi:hypothetical protein
VAPEPLVAPDIKVKAVPKVRAKRVPIFLCVLPLNTCISLGSPLTPLAAFESDCPNLRRISLRVALLNLQGQRFVHDGDDRSGSNHCPEKLHYMQGAVDLLEELQ